jgi:hypothetical protein
MSPRSTEKRCNDRGDTQLINKLVDQQHTSMRTEAVGTSDDIEKTYPTG